MHGEIFIRIFMSNQGRSNGQVMCYVWEKSEIYIKFWPGNL
jgi:hypothetical protein